MKLYTTIDKFTDTPMWWGSSWIRRCHVCGYRL